MRGGKDDQRKGAPMSLDAHMPIGLFDSGIGGLTVLHALRRRLPQEDLIYLGDTARLPYGTKGRETIIRYSQRATQKLVDSGIKMLVIACNTATSAALPTLRKHFAPLPVMGVVEPGAAAAIAASRNKRIAIAATEATIAGGAYQEAIRRRCPEATVIGRACTLFVPLAEEGWTDGPIAEGVAARYLQKIFSEGPEKPDTLLLGCTHFPLFAEALRHVIGPDVRIVDSAATTAQAVEEELHRLRLLRHSGQQGASRFLVTDNPARFMRSGSFFLGEELHNNDVSLIDL